MSSLFGKWAIFLTLINYFDCGQMKPISLKHRALTGMEGSCVEIQCSSTRPLLIKGDSDWFWIKDANWTAETGFIGTIIYSSNKEKHPVSPEFKNRVTSISPLQNGGMKTCSILICDLRKTDSGLYKFRFVWDATDKWITDALNLTVMENPCLITFSQPAPVMENKVVTLTCSTSILCDSSPQINSLEQLPAVQTRSQTNRGKNGTTKSMTFSFTGSWKDDGRVFTCQIPQNNDKYLIRNTTLTVEYAPKDIQASTSKTVIKEGDHLILTCSANGQPTVNFFWFKNENQNQGSQLNFSSIKESDAGSFYCKAQNKHGTVKSKELNIDVRYRPVVHIEIQYESGRYHPHVKEGDHFSLVCTVNRSNPKSHSFTWQKVGEFMEPKHEQKYVFFSVKPKDKGAYQCTATNSVGSGTSNRFYLEVQYKPRSRISISAVDNKVKINSLLTFTCNTEANPEPWFTWYHYKQSDPSNWKLLENKKILTLSRVQRTDEGCYICNASNQIGNGDTSPPECIQVLFPPTDILLSLDSKVKEGQFVTSTCTAESTPLSTFELKRSPSPELLTSVQLSFYTATEKNIFTHRFKATFAHAGFYTCIASNSQGRNTSIHRKLEVEYSPKDVRAEALPRTDVRENETFSIRCNAHSNPPITQFKWTTTKSNENDITVGTEKTYTVNSARPSDSGLYRCEVQNVIGHGKSEVEIKIKYAPKQTTITKGEEQPLPDGRHFVTLSCSSRCYPSAEYVWYNKTDHTKVSDKQTLTVYSDQAGEYYCIAKNEIGATKSDSVRLFDDTVMKIMKVFGLICLILLILVIIVVYRYKINKANQQRTTKSCSCSSFLLIAQGLCSLCKKSERRNRSNEDILTDASRSRDDLLPERCRPKAQHQQPQPDATFTTHHVNVVYSHVNVPHGEQAQFAQRPGNSQQSSMEDVSLNYASIHFQNNKNEGLESIYSQVCKPKPCKQQAQEKPDDYENLHIPLSNRVPYSFDNDTETSDEEEVNYAQVNIIPNASHNTDTADSSTSEEETSYSEVKL